jgi:hypothetical protein
VWSEAAGGLLFEPFAQDEVDARDEELAWNIKGGRRWQMTNGELVKRDQRDRLDDIGQLMQVERPNWKRIDQELQRAGEPVALEGTYGGLNAYPPAQDLAAVTGVTANTALWTTSLYSPIPANSVLTPEAFRMAATGRVTTAAASTMTPNANIGTAAGTGLAAGPAVTLGTTITNALWFCICDITIRAPGTAGVAIGCFKMTIGTTAGSATATTTALFGGSATQTAIDFTAAQGMTFSSAFSVTTVSVTPTQVHWMSWN